MTSEWIIYYVEWAVLVMFWGFVLAAGFDILRKLRKNNNNVKE